MILAPTLTLVNAQVVGEEGVFAHSLKIRHGRIATLNEPPGRGGHVVDLGGDFVFPGLVNAHEHLAHNSFQRLKWRVCYANVREWIEDFQPRFSTDKALSDVLSLPMESRVLQGLVKNLLSGATSVCHHDPPHPVFRRWTACAVLRRLGWSHSLGVDGRDKVATSFRSTPRRNPWIIHAAEGCDAAAAGEFGAMASLGCVADNTVFVHGVALAPEDRQRMLARGASLVWCPSSNLFLFGVTAEIREAASAGRLALGTDSRLSGARDLLEELKIARSTGKAEDKVLCRLVTSAAARVLRLDRRAVLAPGEPADLLVVPSHGGDCHAALVDADRASLRLVMRRGVVHLADPAFERLFAVCGVPCNRVFLDGKAKCLDAGIVCLLKQFSVMEPGLEL
jgi:cytosine/adenosine deaminase-related metal-dependent hydrolase